MCLEADKIKVVMEQNNCVLSCTQYKASATVEVEGQCYPQDTEVTIIKKLYKRSTR